jgi:DNA-binding transcriptional regulator GbsR (MarR family)
MVKRKSRSAPDIDDVIRDSQEQFVAAWGKMASNWGIPRTMAEVHALLYISGEAMTTDEVIERLQISRGNASMSLRALADWGLVTRSHRRGERREFFDTETDVWKLFRTILRERKKREIDPLLVSLHEIRDLTGTESIDGAAKRADVAEHNARIDSMIEFIEMVDGLAERFISPQGRGLKIAAAVLSKVS